VRTSDFDYDLPPELIAQRPAEPRDNSRLLVLYRETDKVEHRRFRQITEYLNPGDVLVLNETRVIPARLKAHKIPTGGAVEILLLKRLNAQTWEALVGGKNVNPGLRLKICDGPTVLVAEDLGGSRRIITFDEPISDQLDDIGDMPVPPYIHTPLQKRDEYQTVFAHSPGSAAAPTAGLHFTESLLETISKRGVLIVKIILHIGLDTFAPVKEERPQDHVIHKEWCQITPGAALTIKQAQTYGGRIIAVGTTCVRALETAALHAKDDERINSYEGETDLFILPGFRFRTVDAMVTNFHLPHSTLLMMVSAFAGRDRILQVYQQAIEELYRFYSFGDAMLIL
jgi:S-adenosylmethionine:tRNA ribosyltransferase-isomerase